MSEVKVASRYAKSLIDLAQDQNILESVKNDIELFSTLSQKVYEKICELSTKDHF